jgi:hypothetical protein
MLNLVGMSFSPYNPGEAWYVAVPKENFAESKRIAGQKFQPIFTGSTKTTHRTELQV